MGLRWGLVGRLFLLASFGLLCIIGGVSAWLAWLPKYTSSSCLRVAMQEKSLLFAPEVGGTGWTDRDRFEIYKDTQQQLLLSRFVLLGALRKPELAKLPSMQYEQKYGDAVGWLSKKLSVGFPGKAEIMQVSITRDDPREAAILVAAVVDSYITEVVNAERDQKRQRLSELDRIYTEKETELRSKRTDLKQLAEQLGTSDTDTLTLKQKLALEELTIYRQEWAKFQFDVRRLRSELATQQALLRNVDTAEIPSADVDALVMSDPVARQLFTELGKKIDEVYTNSVLPTEAKNRYADRVSNEIKTLEEQYNARLAKLREDVRQNKRSLIETEIEELKTSLAVYTEQENTMAEDVQKQRAAVERFGSSSIDIEMMRTDIKRPERVLDYIAAEREKLQIEARAPSRVTLLQRAEEPEKPDDEPFPIVSMASCAIGAVGAIGLLAIGIGWWRKRRKAV